MAAVKWVLWHVVMLCVLVLASCASLPSGPTAAGVKKLPVPAAVQDTSSGLTWLAIAAVLGIGGGVAAAIAMPGDDKIPWGIVGGSVAVLAVSLVLQVSLPFLPWLLGGLIVAAGLWIGTRLYHIQKNKKTEPVYLDLGHVPG